MKPVDKEQMAFVLELTLDRFKALYSSAVSKGSDWDAEIMAFEEALEYGQKELDRRWPDGD